MFSMCQEANGQFIYYLFNLGEWSIVEYDNRAAMLQASKAIMGLRLHEGHYHEIHKNCLNVAIDVKMNLMSAKDPDEECGDLFVECVVNLVERRLVQGPR
jgi:hypothetical protein